MDDIVLISLADLQAFNKSIQGQMSPDNSDCRTVFLQNRPIIHVFPGHKARKNVRIRFLLYTSLMENNAQSAIDSAPPMGIIGQGDVVVNRDTALERLAELSQNMGIVPKSKIKEPPFIKVYTKNTVEQFVKRYMIGSVRAQSLVLVSPFISTLDSGTYNLKSILKRADRDRTRVYVVTRSPEADYQRQGIELLKQFSCVEIRYNPEIHAKLFVCWGRELEESFAFFGSGNLTAGGMRYNLELGMMILAKGEGKNILKALYTWGSHDIRVQSKIVKSIS